jgi:hemolysin-activating ACP:hemolysin acyltransferase
MEHPGVAEEEIDRAAAFVRRFVPAEWPDAAVRFSVATPLWLRQAVRLRGADGELTALLTWAFLDEPLHRRFQRGEERMLDASDWNDGLNVWLIHGCYAAPRPPAAFRRKVRELVAAFGAVHWLWDDGAHLRLCHAEHGSARVHRTVLESALA